MSGTNVIRRDLAMRKTLARAIRKFKGNDEPWGVLVDMQYKEMKVIKGTVVENGIPYKFEFFEDGSLTEIELADNE